MIQCNDQSIGIRIVAVRDQLNGCIEQHEKEHHAGEPCPYVRAHALAYLAHCLGVREELWDLAEDMRSDIDRKCAQIHQNLDEHSEEQGGDFPP